MISEWPPIKWQTARPRTGKAMQAINDEMAAEEKALAIIWDKPPEVALGAAAHALCYLLHRYVAIDVPPGAYVYGIDKKEVTQAKRAGLKYSPGAGLIETRDVLAALSHLPPDAAWNAARRIFEYLEPRHGLGLE